MSGNHTPAPWEIYECPIADASAAKEELAYQVDHTEPVGPTLYLLNAGGKCPALTGCGPSSKANAELIVTAVNSYASSQAEIERLTTLEAELWRLSLVIESAVRNADWPNHADVLALIKSIKRPDAALSGSKE